jgi:fumarate hydratase class II
METSYVSKGGATNLFQFEKDKPGGERHMESAVVQSLNALKKACAELNNDNDSRTKRKREETPTVENNVTEVQ